MPPSNTNPYLERPPRGEGLGRLTTAALGGWQCIYIDFLG